jgi:hypothetical protein
MVRTVKLLSLGTLLAIGALFSAPLAAQEEAAPPAQEPAAAPAEETPAQPAEKTAAQQAEEAKAKQAQDKPPEPAEKPEAADAKPVNPDDAKAPGEGDDFGHGGQFGVRLGLLGGYRMVFRYDESPYCSRPKFDKAPKDQQKFCGHVGPLALDIGLSFAPIDSVEPFLWGRFGLSGESETNTQELILIGAGVRIYTMSDSKFKVFIEPAVGVELEKGAGNPEWNYGMTPDYKTDMVFHLAAGPQFDVAKAVGFYLNAGVTTGVLRYIHSSLELQGGVQVRVP